MKLLRSDTFIFILRNVICIDKNPRKSKIREKMNKNFQKVPKSLKISKPLKIHKKSPKILKNIIFHKKSHIYPKFLTLSLYSLGFIKI